MASKVDARQRGHLQKRHNVVAVSAMMKQTRKSKPIAPPQQNFSRSEWLADILRERILDGKYRPGERLVENEFRQEFGFSNGPIREALQLLALEGLLDRSPWQGVRVIELSREELIELFQVRAALLEYAVELAATRRSATSIAEAPRIKSQLTKTFATTRAGTSPQMRAEFMEWIFRAAGNKKLELLWMKATLQSRVYVYASIRKSVISEAPAYALIDAIVAGDARNARCFARKITSLRLKELVGEEL